MFITLLFIIPVLVPLMDSTEAYAEDLGPLKAYKLQTVPKLDGHISEGEWNDTEVYEYTRNNTAIMNGSIKLQCALKHDDRWLYILFRVMDDEPGGIVDILIMPKDETLICEKAIVIYPNGTVRNGILAKTGIVIDPSSPPNIEVNSTYSNNEYTFEIKLDKSYLNLTHDYAPFNIEYTDDSPAPLYGPNTVSVGDSRYARPGLLLESSYYQHEADDNGREGYMGWLGDNLHLVYLGVVFVGVTAGIYFFWMWKKKRRI